jgi:hypothetical protein
MSKKTNTANLMDHLIFDPFGLASAPKASKKPNPTKKSQFQKLGKNAMHPLTIEMREMKASLGLTTRELVNALSEFEKTQGGDASAAEDTAQDSVPINTVLMSSYLQGWVLQDAFIRSVHGRVKRMYQHRFDVNDVRQKVLETNGIRDVFDGWFAELGIKDKEGTAPIRQFARIIAPFYKRAVSAKFEGVFRLGEKKQGLARPYTITTYEGEVHHFVLNQAEEVLVKSGTAVKRGETIQYAVLYPLVTTKDGGMGFDESSPSEDHTTFFRWYTAKKPPRSAVSLTMVKEAVKAAKLAMESELEV